MTHGNFSLLLTGDASDIAERIIMAVDRPLSVVVYKAGHHGARSSSSQHFLEKIQPQFAIISAGEENRYGHPSPEQLHKAAIVDAAELWTDELGSIEVITDGEQMWWEARDID